MKIKKTFELSNKTVELLKYISDLSETSEVEIVELAINKPKIYNTIVKMYEKLNIKKEEETP